MNIWHLKASPGFNAPLRIHRKMKKRWRKDLMTHVDDMAMDYPNLKFRLRWKPGVGWVLTTKEKRR